MTLDTEDLRGRSVLDLPRSQSSRCSPQARAGDHRLLEDASSARSQLPAPSPQNPAPSPQNNASGALKVEALAPGREDKQIERDHDERGDEPRKGMLRRRPFALVGGLILLFVVLPAGYLYWDHASHFESTDDAFIAARQFAIAPKVPGYLTAVPVTDNQHVAAGQVIAQIDQRDYRNALAVAQASALR